MQHNQNTENMLKHMAFYHLPIMDTATKTGIDVAKTASKRVVQKIAEATRDLTGNIIADKTSVGKSKEKEKIKKVEEIYIPPEKRHQIIDDLKLFSHLIKMEFQKIVNLLDTTSDDKDLPRFVTKKWIKVYDQLGRQNYNVDKEIRIKTQMLRADLCDFSDAYIVVEGEIIVTDLDAAKRNKSVAFKKVATFINCISKINGVQIDSAEDLDVVMPMYNLLEYSKNYRKNNRQFVELLQG